jgi:bifunctional non-homologous end joining protein LigD
VPSDRLEQYRAKRTFDSTPEPSGGEPSGPEPSGGDEETPHARAGEPRFVVQKHAARRLHYDFRLEAEGVLVSWAVPKGPSYDPKEKRLAVHVEDHPLDYEDFEGVIPAAQYGSGTVVVWDRGSYRNITEKRGKPVDLMTAVDNGHVSIWLEGTKLKGGWSLTRTGDGDNWLLIKRSDEYADPSNKITESAPESVKSGLTIEDLAKEPDPETWTRETATWMPPMLAQPLKKTELRAISDDDWQYERKLDGLRCLAVRNGKQVTLWSRNHLQFTQRFPEIVEALGKLPADNFTIDGEVVAFVGSRTSFAELQRPGRDAQPVYCVFDLLQLLGKDTTILPLEDRQRLLAQAVQNGNDRISLVERLEGNAQDLLDDACKKGWEGLIAKRISAPYQSGRSHEWRKVKCSASQELVVVGWTDPTGSRVGFGALLVGYYDKDQTLHYAGKVGTGFDDKTLRELHRRLKESEIDTCPVTETVKEKKAHWVRPELVAEITFTEWTNDGRLRHPSFQGLRPDKKPIEVRREDQMA